jgi:hypothetical protein
LIDITPTGQDRIRPRFQIRFAAGTFDQQDSQVVATYPGGLRYRLIPDDLAAGTMFVVIERLKVGRSIQVSLSNPLGGSSGAVVLPKQPFEDNQFECINCSTCWSCGSVNAVPLEDTASVSHNQNSLLPMGGTDTIPLHPVRTDPPDCDQEDHMFTTARVSVLHAGGLLNPPTSGPGTVRITRHPPKNVLLRKPENTIRVKWWKPGLVGDWWYQVVPNGVTVVGVCSNRIVH